jgi:hypothetical protein
VYASAPSRRVRRTKDADGLCTLVSGLGPACTADIARSTVPGPVVNSTQIRTLVADEPPLATVPPIARRNASLQP